MGQKRISTDRGGGGVPTSKTNTKGAVSEVQEERSNTPGEVRDVQEVTTSKKTYVLLNSLPFTFSSFLNTSELQSTAQR